MVFSEIGHQLESGDEFIVGIVVLLLLAEHGSQGKMQGRVVWIRGNHREKFSFSVMEFLGARRSVGPQQPSRNTRPNQRRLNIPGAQYSHQLLAGPRSLDL